MTARSICALALLTFLSRQVGRAREMSDELPECKFVDSTLPYGNRTTELVCLYGLSYSLYIDSPETVSSLTVLNWREEGLDALAVLTALPRLRRLSIINGSLSRILTPFPAHARSLQVVEISGTRLRDMPDWTFAQLPALRILDLRRNALAHFEPDDLVGIDSLREVYLSGNQWTCDESSAWLVNDTYGSLVERIADRDSLRCWTPFKGRPLLFVMEVVQRLDEECRQLAVCECELVYVVNSAAALGNPTASSTGPTTLQQQQQQQPSQQQQQQAPLRQQRQFMAFASVNCSHRGFTDMPSFLPANTTTLHLEGNKISDLSPLKMNPVYRSVIDLYLDDNQVESVNLLDGTDWLEHFRLLSLRGNKMSNFATYALENVLPHSQTAASLYLGNNPWRCDCEFTPGFQEFLIKYGYLIKDMNDIKCSNNTDFSNRQVREIMRKEICKQPIDTGMYGIDILNACLLLLIILLFVNLIYDYHIYKSTGRLPKIAYFIP